MLSRRALLASLAGAGVLRAQLLPSTEPGAVGLAADRFPRLRQSVDDLAKQLGVPGWVGLVARKGKVAYFDASGVADLETGKPMRKDSIVRIYSMTKPITGVAMMSLFEEGKFTLNDPVSRYLPEFKQMNVAVEKTAANGQKSVYTVPAEKQITIRDLMRHTSGLAYANTGPKNDKGEYLYVKAGIEGAVREGQSLEEVVKKLASMPLMEEPGTTYRYAMGIDVLGRLVEVVAGKPLDEFMAERIFRPLAMTDTNFWVPEEKWGRLATLYYRKPDGSTGLLKGNPQQDGYKKKPSAFMGGAGLASTATDYLRFAQMLANGGKLDGAKILAPKTVELMRADHLGDLPRPIGGIDQGYGFGLTMAVNRGPGQTGDVGSAGEFNWSGAAGTHFWVDPQEQMVGIFLIQRFGDDFRLAKLFKRQVYQALV